MLHLKRIICFFLISYGILVGMNTVQAQSKSGKKKKTDQGTIKENPVLLIRCDDVGMCHAVNMATKEMIETGLPFSASVMFACPWYQEAVEILKKNPQVSVGIHLTLGAEWKNYRWGPISSKDKVPSLLDSLGYFHATPAIHLAHNPNINEIETEFRAQIERALGTGLRIDYLDNHMGAGLYTPEQRAVLEKLAREYKLGISGYFGEESIPGIAGVPIEEQADSISVMVSRLKTGAPQLLVTHLGLQTPEMDAMEDFNAKGTKQMSRQRQIELQVLSSPAFKKAIEQHQVKLITYRDLIREKGLEQMKPHSK